MRRGVARPQGDVPQDPALPSAAAAATAAGAADLATAVVTPASPIAVCEAAPVGAPVPAAAQIRTVPVAVAVAGTALWNEAVVSAQGGAETVAAAVRFAASPAGTAAAAERIAAAERVAAAVIARLPLPTRTLIVSLRGVPGCSGA